MIVNTDAPCLIELKVAYSISQYDNDLVDNLLMLLYQNPRGNRSMAFPNLSRIDIQLSFTSVHLLDDYLNTYPEARPDPSHEPLFYHPYIFNAAPQANSMSYFDWKDRYLSDLRRNLKGWRSQIRMRMTHILEERKRAGARELTLLDQNQDISSDLESDGDEFCIDLVAISGENIHSMS